MQELGEGKLRWGWAELPVPRGATRVIAARLPGGSTVTNPRGSATRRDGSVRAGPAS